MTAPDAVLLREAKDKCRITWVDEDAQVWRLVEAATTDLNQMFSRKLNYEEPGKPKTLMLEHVFYNRNNVLHEFRKDYAQDLLELALDVVAGVYDDTAAE